MLTRFALSAEEQAVGGEATRIHRPSEEKNFLVPRPAQKKNHENRRGKKAQRGLHHWVASSGGKKKPAACLPTVRGGQGENKTRKGGLGSAWKKKKKGKKLRPRGKKPTFAEGEAGRSDRSACWSGLCDSLLRGKKRSCGTGGSASLLGRGKEDDL